MNITNKIVIIGVLLLAAFAAGRYTATKSANKTEQTSTNIDINKSKNTHTTTTTTTVKDPNGETKTITTTDTTINSEVSKKEDTSKSTQTKPSSYLNVSALGGYDVHKSIPIYGVSVSKQAVGPITIGLWGLSPGIIGASVGLNF